MNVLYVVHIQHISHVMCQRLRPAIIARAQAFVDQKTLHILLYPFTIIMRIILHPALPGELWPSSSIDLKRVESGADEDVLRGLAQALDVPSACVRIAWSCAPERWESGDIEKVVGMYYIERFDADNAACKLEKVEAEMHTLKLTWSAKCRLFGMQASD